MVLLAAGNPLAGSTASPPMADKIRHIRVVRAFYWEGKVVPVGAVLELPANRAPEFIATNKAVYCDPPSAAPTATEEPQKSRAARKE